MTTDTASLLALPPMVLSCVAVVALVLCDYRQIRMGRYLFKPLAAAAFVWLALVPGEPGSSYSTWLLGGLLCCMAGDLLLMPDNERFFLAGLIAFLCGHLLYAMAFLQLPGNMSGLIVSVPIALALAFVAGRWLGPHVDSSMKIPVALYTLVITGMLICAGLSAGHPAAWFIIAGAWGFALSDLAVARQQFLIQSPRNGLWGTPLYFLSQMLLAFTTSLA